MPDSAAESSNLRTGAATVGETAIDHPPLVPRVGLLGFGEVGQIFAADLRAQGVSVAAFDKALADGKPSARCDAMRAHAAAHGVALSDSAAALAAASDWVISAVTASQAVSVADECAAGLRAGAAYLDLNSASPGAKQRAADIVQAVGAQYVEAAVMTSVPPYRIRVPMLLGGPHATARLPELLSMGFAASVASTDLGVASAVKMCRSVMIKGLEAMVIESFTTARALGVEDAMLATLAETFPGIDWECQGAYFFQRVIAHGRRRSEEVAEVAHTVREAGLTPWSAEGTTKRQAWMADLADAGVFGERSGPDFARSADWRVEADRILAVVRAATAGHDQAPTESVRQGQPQGALWPEEKAA